MRPIGINEFKRMRDQTELALAGKSRISFNLMAKKAGEPTTRWSEDGFMCDFKFADQNRTSDQQLYSEQWVHDTVRATAVFPMRYLTNKSEVFTVKNPIGKEAGWSGSTFDPLNIPVIGTIDGTTVVPPHVETVTLTRYDGGVRGNLADFAVIGQPILSADSFAFRLEGTFSVNVISQYDTPSNQGWAYYLLLADAFGGAPGFRGGATGTR